MGTQLFLDKMGQDPQFSAHVYCGQTAGWIKMPLGTEVDLGPGHIVLDGEPAPPGESGTAALLFSAHISCGHGCPSQLLLSSYIGVLCSHCSNVYLIFCDLWVVHPRSPYTSLARIQSPIQNKAIEDSRLRPCVQRIVRLHGQTGLCTVMLTYKPGISVSGRHRKQGLS